LSRSSPRLLEGKRETLMRSLESIVPFKDAWSQADYEQWKQTELDFFAKMSLDGKCPRAAIEQRIAGYDSPHLVGDDRGRCIARYANMVYKVIRGGHNEDRGGQRRRAFAELVDVSCGVLPRPWSRDRRPHYPTETAPPLCAEVLGRLEQARASEKDNLRLKSREHGTLLCSHGLNTVVEPSVTRKSRMRSRQEVPVANIKPRVWKGKTKTYSAHPSLWWHESSSNHKHAKFRSS